MFFFNNSIYFSHFIMLLTYILFHLILFLVICILDIMNPIFLVIFLFFSYLNFHVNL